MDSKNREKIWASETEYLYVFDFIDAYLNTRNLSKDGDNAYIIKNFIDIYPGRMPILLADLIRFLDKRLRLKNKAG